MSVTTALEEKINAVVNSTSRMVLATSVDGLSSSASVFFARDGDDFLFFTFNPTRKARQIAFNPAVQMSIWPSDENGIREIRVEDWNEVEADRQRLPYSLLKVNAITIGIHFSTGILLVLAYTLQTPY